MLAGNALYFLLLAPRLPAWVQHRPLRADPGLVIDFLICLTIYLVLGRIGRSRRDVP